MFLDSVYVDSVTFKGELNWNVKRCYDCCFQRHSFLVFDEALLLK